MRINSYLIFDGDCEAAFNRYAEVLGAQLSLFRFGESPARDEVSAEFHQRIMHVCLQVGEQQLMGSDSLPTHPGDGFQGFSISLNVDSIDEAERLFGALAQGGSIQMPLAETFWAKRFGMLTDRFGVSWMINHSLPEN